jgi:hypothetical protein
VTAQGANALGQLLSGGEAFRRGIDPLSSPPFSLADFAGDVSLGSPCHRPWHCDPVPPQSGMSPQLGLVLLNMAWFRTAPFKPLVVVSNMSALVREDVELLASAAFGGVDDPAIRKRAAVESIHHPMVNNPSLLLDRLGDRQEPDDRRLSGGLQRRTVPCY